MTPSTEAPVAIPLSHVGQELRKQGLGVDVSRLRKAIEAGDVRAQRRGHRWFMLPEDALPYARPLREPGSAARVKAA